MTVDYSYYYHMPQPGFCHLRGTFYTAHGCVGAPPLYSLPRSLAEAKGHAVIMIKSNCYSPTTSPNASQHPVSQYDPTFKVVPNSMISALSGTHYKITMHILLIDFTAFIHFTPPRLGSKI